VLYLLTPGFWQCAANSTLINRNTTNLLAVI